MKEAGGLMIATSSQWTKRLSKPYRYFVAALVFVLALGARFAVLPVEAGLAFTTFYPAVFLVYYFLGVGPGVMVMLFSAYAGYYIFHPPFWSLDITLDGFVVTATFIVSNSLIGWLTLRHVSALSDLEKAHEKQKELHQQLELALNEANDLYAKAPFGYYSLSPAGEIVRVNDKFLTWVEAEERDVIGTPITDYFDLVGQSTFRDNFQRFKSDGHIEGLKFELHGRKGGIRQVSVSATAIFDGDGELLRSRSVMFDITELHAAKGRVESQRMLLTGVVEGLPFGVALFDDQQILHRFNKRCVQMLGYDERDLGRPGFSFRDLIRMNGERGDYGDKPWGEIYGQLSMVMKQRTGTHFERQTYDGRWLEIYGITVFDGWTLLTYTDITAQKKASTELEEAKHVAERAVADQQAAHDEAQYIAYHDPLTGLPNRRLFANRAEQAIAVAQRQGEMLAVCYLDLDGFKGVNDTHGHEAGDRLLKVVANRLTDCVRAQDTVCRLGGDEFVLLLTSFASEAEVQMVLQRVLVEIAEPVPIGKDMDAEVSVSIGYALFPEDATEKGFLMRNADHAMYEAKRRGKNCILRHRLDD
jgi:diguanylate cyclase (GGDEF)-like protein